MIGRKLVGGALATTLVLSVGYCDTRESSPHADTPAATAMAEYSRPTWLEDRRPGQDCLADWSVKQLVGQVVVAGISGTDLEADAKIFDDYDIGGAILMSSPTDPYDGSINKFKDSEKIPILMSTDQEGGTVVRFRNLHAPQMPSEAEAASSYSLASIGKIVRANAQQLKKIGIDQDDAPVVDRKQGANPLGSRVFSSNESVVAEYALTYEKAITGADLISTGKHFPGALSVNSDYAMSTSPSLSKLRKDGDLTPYIELSKIQKKNPKREAAIMVGTTRVPGTTGLLPADLSSAMITGELTDREGFNGINDLILTDDLGTPSIASLGYSVPQAMELAIEAGADEAMIVVQPETTTALRTQLSAISEQLVAAVIDKRLSITRLDDAVIRVVNAKGYAC